MMQEGYTRWLSTINLLVSKKGIFSRSALLSEWAYVYSATSIKTRILTFHAKDLFFQRSCHFIRHILRPRTYKGRLAVPRCGRDSCCPHRRLGDAVGQADNTSITARGSAARSLTSDLVKQLQGRSE